MVVACATNPYPALAAEPKPDAALKTKAIEATVFLDDRIKADPALAADSLRTAESGSTKMPPMPPPN
jgi:hypothetical protein